MLQAKETIKFSIIVPVFNEGAVIAKVLQELRQFLAGRLKDSFEIIVINDGSTDNTKQALAELALADLKIVHHLSNKGYGASLKKGTEKARGRYLAFFDGDGQHQPADLVKLLESAGPYDMVVGSREGWQGPLWRQPGKKLLTLLANYLVASRIPDLNSGLRVVKKESFDKFKHLLPNKFSLTTTLTLAFLKQGLEVKYLSIQIKARQGKSTLKLTDGFKTILLVLRMIMLFSPLQVFLPLAFILAFLGLPSLFYDIFFKGNINDSSVLLTVSSILIFVFGLLADQLASARRELKL